MSEKSKNVPLHEIRNFREPLSLGSKKIGLSLGGDIPIFFQMRLGLGGLLSRFIFVAPLILSFPPSFHICRFF